MNWTKLLKLEEALWRAGKLEILVQMREDWWWPWSGWESFWRLRKHVILEPNIIWTERKSMKGDNLQRQTGHVLQKKLREQNETAGLGLRTVPRYFRCSRMKCLLNKSTTNKRWQLTAPNRSCPSGKIAPAEWDGGPTCADSPAGFPLP